MMKICSFMKLNTVLTIQIQIIMRKLYSFLAVVTTTVFLTAQTNLVTNPSFDSGTSGWLDGPSSSYQLPTIDAADGHNGSNSADYSGVSATTGFYQEIAVTAGNTYRISFWYKAQGDDKDARIWSYYQDAAGDRIDQGPDSSSDPLLGPNNGYLDPVTDWTEYTVDVVAPANVVKLLLAVRAYKNNTMVKFDDFSVVDITNLAVTEVEGLKENLVKNTLVQNEIIFGAAADVQVLNMAGQVLKTAKVEEGTRLNISNLPAGIYLVTGKTDNAFVSKKIVKQ